MLTSQQSRRRGYRAAHHQQTTPYPPTGHAAARRPAVRHRGEKVRQAPHTPLPQQQQLQLQQQQRKKRGREGGRRSRKGRQGSGKTPDRQQRRHRATAAAARLRRQPRGQSLRALPPSWVCVYSVGTMQWNWGQTPQIPGRKGGGKAVKGKGADSGRARLRRCCTPFCRGITDFFHA